jgi:hypothetical protein
MQKDEIEENVWSYSNRGQGVFVSWNLIQLWVCFIRLLHVPVCSTQESPVTSIQLPKDFLEIALVPHFTLSNPIEQLMDLLPFPAMM